MVSAISGEKESAIRVTMLSCASFFCSPTLHFPLLPETI